MHRWISWIGGLALAAAGCGGGTNLCKDVEGECVEVEASDNMTEAIQTALIDAEPNTTVVIDEGTFQIESELSLIGVDGVTIRGQGPDATVLDFADAGGGGGAAGIKAEDVKDFTVESLAVEDTSGDGLFVLQSDNVTIRNVRVEWTRGPDMDNGRYGIYPLKCDGVLVEGSYARGASDAGIYVGESNQIIVRNSEADENVAGIQIENSYDSHVHDNHAHGNSAGLMIFDLAGKERQKNGANHLAHDNLIENNNTTNFGAEGAAVAELPAGTGVLVLATDAVELRNNTIENNETLGVAIASYFLLGDPSDDPEFYPYPTRVWVHDNEFENNGTSPDTTKLGGQAAAALGGVPVPELLYDGIPPEMPVEDSPTPETNPQYLCFANNAAEDGEAVFVDLDAEQIDFDDPAGTLDEAMPTNDITPFECEGPTQPEVTLDFAE